MLENEYQHQLIEKLRVMFPTAIVVKNDPNYIQGVPDLGIYGTGGKYALLEVKINRFASHQPNQDYYINRGKSNGGYCEFIYPENEKEILQGLQQYFKDAEILKIAKA